MCAAHRRGGRATLSVSCPETPVPIEPPPCIHATPSPPTVSQDAVRHRRKGRPVKALPPPKVASLPSLRRQAAASYAAAWREREQTPSKAGEATVPSPAETSSARTPLGARQRKQMCPVRSFVSVV